MSLARPAHDISLLQIVEAAGGPLRPMGCTVNARTCPVHECLVQVLWCESLVELEKRLAAIRLDQILGSERLERG